MTTYKIVRFYKDRPTWKPVDRRGYGGLTLEQAKSIALMMKQVLQLVLHQPTLNTLLFMGLGLTVTQKNDSLSLSYGTD